MLDYTPRAPAIHVPKKSTHGPCDEARAVYAALELARGARVPLPICFGKQLLGYAVGTSDPRDRASYFAKASRMTPLECTWQNYSQIQSSIAAGQWIRYSYLKTASTAALSLQWWDLWPVSGNPTAGTYSGTAYTARSLTYTDIGAMMVGNKVSPLTKNLLSFATSNASTNNQCTVLYDRVLTYEACSFNASVTQNMTNTTTAARYNGAGLSGMQIMFTGQTNFGATGVNLTDVTYVDQDGNTKSSPTTTTMVFFQTTVAPTTTLGARVCAPCPGSASVPWWWAVPLANSSIGARSVTSFTTSAANTGTFAIVLARPLAYIFSPVLGTVTQVDQVVNYTCLETIYDGACLSLLGMGVNNNMTGNIYGEVMVGWG